MKLLWYAHFILFKMQIQLNYLITLSNSQQSSDEELSTALHFMGGEILVVTVVLDKKKKKNALLRTLHQGMVN